MKYYKLEELCDDIIDCPHSTPKWRSEGIPVIRNFNIVDGKLNFDNPFFVDEETYNDRIKRGKPTEGDLVFSREAPVGSVAMIPKNFKGCLGQRLVLLKVNENKCSSEYLLYAMMSDFVKKQYHVVNKSGSIVSNFNIGDLKKLIIPVPENNESISEVLASLDAKINLNNKIHLELESILKMIYDYWFIQFNFPNDDGNPYKINNGMMVWNEELKSKIPQLWDVNELKELFDEQPKSKLKVEDADNCGMFPFFTSGESVLKHSTFLVDGNVCFLNTGGNVDIKHYWGKSAYSTDTWCIQGKQNYENYLYLYLVSIKKSMKNFFSGSGLKHLNKKAFKSIKVLIPPENIVISFNNIVNPIFLEFTKLYLENEELKNLRDFILPLLINEQLSLEI